MKKVIILFAFILSGCSIVGETPLEKLARAEISITQGYITTRELLEVNRISASTANQIRLGIDTADNLIERAKSLYSQDNPNWINVLNEALTAILRFQTQLNESGANVSERSFEHGSIRLGYISTPSSPTKTD